MPLPALHRAAIYIALGARAQNLSGLCSKFLSEWPEKKRDKIPIGEVR
jgi:hypothetical protein